MPIILHPIKTEPVEGGVRVTMPYEVRLTPAEESRLVAAFAAWRFDAWLKGYGSYREIHEKIDKGELKPMQELEDQIGSADIGEGEEF